MPHLKKIPKTYKSHDTPLGFWGHQHFHQNLAIFLNKQKMYFYTFFPILLTFLIISTKLVTPGLLGIKVTWSKRYDIINFVYDVTNKILASESNFIVKAALWPRFGNSSISTREVIITSFLWEFDQKINFFWGMVLVQVQ